jgi:putative endonuclease
MTALGDWELATAPSEPCKYTKTSVEMTTERLQKITIFGTIFPHFVDSYFVYILTNSNRTTLYLGVTNDLSRRLQEHYAASLVEKGFTGKYKTHHLIYFEEFQDIKMAIDREKQLKKWNRAKKDALITSLNPQWKFLETEI